MRAAQIIPLRHRRSRKCRQPTPEQLTEKLEIKSTAHWRYLWHEEILKRSDLTMAARVVAGVLMHRFHIERGYAEASIRWIARYLGCSPNTAARGVQELRRAQLLEPINEGERKEGTRALSTHRYRLCYKTRGVQ